MKPAREVGPAKLLGSAERMVIGFPVGFQCCGFPVEKEAGFPRQSSRKFFAVSEKGLRRVEQFALVFL